MDTERPQKLKKLVNEANDKVAPALVAKKRKTRWPEQKPKVVYEMVGTEEENAESVNRAFDILFAEVRRRQKEGLI